MANTRASLPVRGSAWARMVDGSPAAEWLDTALRGSGQVVFMNSPLTGLLNIAAMFWGAWAGGTTLAVAIGSVLGAMIATATAHALRADRGRLRIGLYGFNGMLVGAGLPTFLAAGPLMWAVLAFACAISTVVTLGVDTLARAWRIPGLTFPFVLTTWLVLLAAWQLPGLGPADLPAATLASGAAAADGAFGPAAFIRASLTSVSQVFFVDDPLSGLIFLAALAVQSRLCALLAAGGAMLAVAAALALGADREAVAHGLWGYSAVLTAVATGGVFLAPGATTLALCAAATLFTVLVQGAAATLAGTFGLPPLTFPFVLVTWLFLLARSGAEPGA